MSKNWKTAICGAFAGTVNGLFGAGGGMVLVPLLSAMTDISEEAIFPCSISIIFPICLVSLTIRSLQSGFALSDAWPFLLGSVAGGIFAGRYAHKIPVKWMHRGLGILILWGGMRYLCS